jgi:hypothetical protein
MSTEKNVGIDAESMKDMLVAVLAEARKPADPTPEQVAQRAQDLQMRKEQGQLVLQTLANKRREQEDCIHMRRDNTTTAVYIASGNYCICQQCQAIVRPGVAPEGYSGQDFYDTQLFNRLWTLSQDPTIF